MVIVIVNDHISGRVSNEKNLWSVLVDNLPNAIGISTNELEVSLEKKLDEINPELVIQNANLGHISDYPTISFLQDPLIEMQRLFETSLVKLRAKLRGRELYYPKLIQKQLDSLQGNIAVTNSDYMAYMYRKHKLFNVINMGVDTDLFKPMNKKEVRLKYGIPLDKKVNTFVGSSHPVKGFNEIKMRVNSDRNVFWILILKNEFPRQEKNYQIFSGMDQTQLAELYNCADELVSASKTESFGLAMIEAMMCDIPVEHTDVGVFWDWKPDMINPRKEALEHGLDIQSCLNNWKELVRRITILQ